MPSSVSSPMPWLTTEFASYSSRSPNRNVPAVVTFFTRKCSENSSGGRRAAYDRDDGVYRDAGVFLDSALRADAPCCTRSETGRSSFADDRRCVAPDRATFDRSVHPLVGAVLLRSPRMNPVMLNPKAPPPYVEIRQAMDGPGGEGHPVVRPNRVRHAVLAERTLKDRLRREVSKVSVEKQPMAGEAEARMLIGDRERIAVHTVPRTKLPFEVRGP